MTFDEAMKQLRLLSKPNKKDLEGMERFGINTENAWCISIPKLRKLAKEVGKDHQMALKIWNSGVHEARIFASLIDEPNLVTEKQMEKWVKDFDSWDVCDQVCSNLFDKTKFAYKKAMEWSHREEEFVKRAGFVLMAALATHDKNAEDAKFLPFYRIIEIEATDDRNFVRKAVNWALRGIAKSRSKYLYNTGLKTAYRIKNIDSKSTKWIAGNAIMELEKDYIKNRFKLTKGR